MPHDLFQKKCVFCLSHEIKVNKTYGAAGICANIMLHMILNGYSICERYLAHCIQCGILWVKNPPESKTNPYIYIGS